MPLHASEEPLTECYDVAMLDLDGVVYVGQDAVAGAAAALAQARSEGMQLAFVTNNAARSPQAVAKHLRELDIDAEASEVITSAQAAARYLSDRLPAGAKVLVLGASGLVAALRERGLTPVDEASDDVAAVVQGYSPDMNWRLLAEGSVAIRAGALWIATNLDPTVPSARGPLPGNGSLVAALRTATGTEPVATGKPDPTMHRETLIRTGAQRPIVVGDRLDTDIEGANAVGCASLLVFTGVTQLPELLAARPELRPTYLAADVGGLLTGHPEVSTEDGSAACGRWVARQVEGGLELAAGARGHSDTAAGAHTADDGAAEELADDDTAAEERADEDTAAGGDDGERTAAGSNGSGWTLAARLDDDALDAVRALCGAAWDGEGVSAPDGEIQVGAADGDNEARQLLDRLGL